MAKKNNDPIPVAAEDSPLGMESQGLGIIHARLTVEDGDDMNMECTQQFFDEFLEPNDWLVVQD